MINFLVMRITDVQRELLRTIVRRFLNTKEPTPRIHLVKQVEDPDVVDALIPVILRNPTGEKPFPTALAFECCDDPEALQVAKKSVETVIHVLKNLFEIELEKVDFKTTEVEEHARIMFPALDPTTIMLGLYLVQDFTGIHAGIGGSWPNITFVRVHEKIGLLQDIAGAWAEHVKKYSIYLQAEADRPSKPDEPTLNPPVPAIAQQEDAQWDFFISHASEDKQAIARPLADALIAKGMKVWYDEFSLNVGDSLRESIDRGLSQSRFGVVILSRHFFAKHWPQKELNGLATREVDGKKVILPVWHTVGVVEVRAYSPMFADRIAVNTEKGLEHVVEKVLAAAGLPSNVVSESRPSRQTIPFKESVNEKRKSGVAPLRKRRRVPLSARSVGLAESPQCGRLATQDGFLLGARNGWAALLEESWPEIGWHLSCVRDAQNGTIEDIRRTFEPVKEKPHNPGLAAPLHRQSFEIASPDHVWKNREQLGKWGAEIITAEAKRDEYQRACRDAEAALKLASSADKSTIQDEATKCHDRLLKLEENIKTLQNERDTLDLKVRDQEAYVFRSELLDFLLSGRDSVNPRNMANALAGLPRTKWRQSFSQCSGMPFNPPRFEYSVFEAMSEVWGHRSEEFEEPPFEFFRGHLLKLPERYGYARQFLWDNWSDLRKAIGECWRSKQPPASIPFALTSVFMRHATQQKNPVERILAARDKLGA